MRKVLLLVFVAVLGIAGCTKSGGSDDGDAGDSGGTPSGESGQITTDCGIVSTGQRFNPISQSQGVQVGVEPTGSNLLIVTIPEGRLLLKLQGLYPVDDYLASGAMAKLNELAAAGRPWFFQAAPDCSVTLDNGAVGTVGQLVTPDGRSYSEELIRSGFASVDTSDVCGGSLIGSCYAALAQSSKRVVGTIQHLLWKPASDVTGLLVVLVDVYDAYVYVNGQFIGTGEPSNGWGSTVRATRPGCTYGSNVRVSVKDSKGGIYLFPGGQEEYVVPNGCVRTQF